MSQENVEQTMWQVLWFRAEKISRWQLFRTEAEAHEAVGLSQ